jgi:hypothetical protein
MAGKKFTASESRRVQANLDAGERALARRARFVRRGLPEDRKRPPEGGDAVPAVVPKKPTPIIGGASAPIE